LAKVVSIDPQKRYEELSEFIYYLRHPNAEFAAATRPILERNPLLFWKLTSLVLSLVVAALLYRLAGLH